MGLLQGAYVKYFPDGYEAEIGQFTADRLHGQCIEFYPVIDQGMNWYVKSVKEYTHGLPHGIWLDYDRDGLIQREDEYVYGELVFSNVIDTRQSIGLTSMSMPIDPLIAEECPICYAKPQQV